MLNTNYLKKIALYAIIGGQFLVITPVFAYNDTTTPPTMSGFVVNIEFDSSDIIACQGLNPANNDVELVGDITGTIYEVLPFADFPASINHEFTLVDTPENKWLIYCGTDGVPNSPFYTTVVTANWNNTNSPIQFGGTVAHTFAYVSNVNQDIMNGFMVMGFSLWFVIWFFKIDRKTRK